MRRFLKALLILQEVSNKDKDVKLGKGFRTVCRLNPFNPLSYVTIIITIIVGLIMFGFVGIWKEMDFKNPFKWQ